VQVRGIERGYPFYGRVETEPAGLWPQLAGSRDALVEPALLVALAIEPGDTVQIGQATFHVAGVLTRPPVEIGFRSAIAPRVFVAAGRLQDAGLIRFGSLVTYQAFFRVPDAQQLERLVDRNHALFRTSQVSFTTAEQEGEELAEALSAATRFLGLVGLTALLLGGLGVSSAVHAYIREKRPVIAVLRCVGATQRTAFGAYLAQSAMLGLGGAAAGTVLGLAAQAALPAVLGSAIPVDVAFRVRWLQLAMGLGIGLWVSLIFTLLPLLEVRGIPPLQALRREVEATSPRLDAWRGIERVIALSVLEAPRRPGAGLAFAGGLAAALAALRALAWALMRVTRRLLSARAPFAVRQGVAGLFRPNNQTAAVTVGLGFGVFLIATILGVQRSLLGRIQIDDAGAGPNLVVFDIQQDQRDHVSREFAALGLPPPVLTPIVPARITRINDLTIEELLSGPRARSIEPWALRREYRHTYRGTLSDAERIIAGEWWEDRPGARAPMSRADRAPADTRRPGADSLPRVSVEVEIADNLGLALGDRITWDVQGVTIETRVASVRRVDWARFETNFFFVFEPGVLEDVPQTFVTLARVADAGRLAALQRDLARSLPNVSTLDLSLVQDEIARIVDRVTLAIRFMGLFCVAGGVLVLVGAITASRFQRLRETVLLRTLGASRRQIRQVLLSEYAALGSLTGIAGTLLGAAAAWTLMRYFFEMPFSLATGPLLVLALAVAAGATTIGTASSRGVLRRPPLATLRETGE
jgi:putative ABC transport system permease protein